jgi:hypothetical protein
VPQSVVLSASGMLNGVRTLAFIGQTEAMSEHHPLLMTAIGAASHELKKDPKCKYLHFSVTTTFSLFHVPLLPDNTTALVTRLLAHGCYCKH